MALSYPIFLKGSSFGSSIGVFKVEKAEDFIGFFQEIRKLGENRILAEEYIKSDFELECGFVDFGEEIFIPEGVISGGDFYDFDEKYGSSGSFSANLSIMPEDISKKVVEFSKLLKDCIGIRYISRFDFFIRDGEVIFNEINAFPGMTKTSLYPKMLEKECSSFSIALTKLIDYAIKNDRTF